MFGNGISGIGSNLLRVATILIWDQDVDKNKFIGAMSLYMFAFVVLAACALAQVCLHKNSYAIYNLHKIEQVSDNKTAEELMVENGQLPATNLSAPSTRQS